MQDAPKKRKVVSTELPAIHKRLVEMAGDLDNRP
jgi:hypothetical protein